MINKNNKANPRVEIDRQLYHKLAELAESRGMSVPKFVQDKLQYVASDDTELVSDNVVELNDALYGYYMTFGDFEEILEVESGKLDRQINPMTHRMISLIVNKIFKDSQLSSKRKGQIVFAFLAWILNHMHVSDSNTYHLTRRDWDSLCLMVNELSSMLVKVLMYNRDEQLSFKSAYDVVNVMVELSTLSRSLNEDRSRFGSALNTFYAIGLLPTVVVFHQLLSYLNEHDAKVVVRNLLGLMIGFNLRQDLDAIEVYHLLGNLSEMLVKHHDEDVGDLVVHKLKLKI